MLLKVKYQNTKKYIRLLSEFTFLDFIAKAQTPAQDIILEIQIDPGPSATTQDGISEEDFSPLDHSTSTSLTDTDTSLSSDKDHSSRIEHGIPIGRCTSSQVIPRPNTEVSESEAAKEMVKNALLCKPGGEDVIEEYNAEKSVTHRTRRQLVNILASHMTEIHGEAISFLIHSQDEASVFQKMKMTFQYRQDLVHDPQRTTDVFKTFPRFLDVKGLLNQDFFLLFGAETSSKMLEKWDTTFRPKVINEAKHLTQSVELCRLQKAAEKTAENDDTTWASDMASLLLLLHLLPPTAGRKRTKISPSDAVNKMLHFHKSCCSLDEHLLFDLSSKA
uniref:Uncharacterized protein n=1 Tax=Knipowitschia caucasica TaxID=637954 RepID=A0AAV2KKK2_KNICA